MKEDRKKFLEEIPEVALGRIPEKVSKGTHAGIQKRTVGQIPGRSPGCISQKEFLEESLRNRNGKNLGQISSRILDDFPGGIPEEKSEGNSKKNYEEIRERIPGRITERALGGMSEDNLRGILKMISSTRNSLGNPRRVSFLRNPKFLSRFVPEIPSEISPQPAHMSQNSHDSASFGCIQVNGKL